MDLLAHGLPPGPVGGQFDGHVAGPLVNRGGATQRPWPETLDRRALVHEGAVDLELVGAELVGGLGVGHGGVQKLEDVGGDGARGMQQDRLRLLDALAANVVHHETRLARRGAHVASAGAHRHGLVGASGRCLAGTCAGLGGTATAPRLLFGCFLIRAGCGSCFLTCLLNLFAGRGLLLGSRRRRRARLGHVVVGQARDQLFLLAALGEAASLELGLQLVDLQRLPTALRRRIDLVRRRQRTLTLSLPAWPRNIRVGANSPSLCPTIDSEMNTGTCLRPSWTAIVWPTISGKITEVRDQVLIICLLPDSFIASMRDIRRSCTNGPFLDERDIYRRPFLPRRRPRTM